MVENNFEYPRFLVKYSVSSLVRSEYRLSMASSLSATLAHAIKPKVSNQMCAARSSIPLQRTLIPGKNKNPADEGVGGTASQ